MLLPETAIDPDGADQRPLSIHLPQTPLTPPNGIALQQETIRCVAVALTIFLVWLTSTLTLFHLNLSGLSPWWLGVGIGWQMFLFTGLFITAHDAMHGVACPGNLRLNHAIGTVAVLCYGLFSYKSLLKKHWLHHHFPGSDRDPDFHDGRHRNPIAWYFHFMQGYWNWGSIVGLMVIFNLINYGLHIPSNNLTLFWVVPSLLSSVQLFFFGTFLTHREPRGGYTNRHRAQSTSFPVWWSFITCYHFGYHQEHHEYPHLPWWRLPEIRRRWK